MTHNFRHLLTRFAVSALLLVSLPAQAWYLDRDEFLANTTGTTNLDFEGIANEGSYSYLGQSWNIGGVQFESTYGSNWVIDDGYYERYYNWGSGAIMMARVGSVVTAYLPEDVTAIGTDYMGIVNGSDGVQDYTVTLSNGESIVVSSNQHPNRAFIGFTSLDGLDISSVTFSASEGWLQFDNFVFGQALDNSTSVPVPAPLALLVLGLVGIAGRNARRA